MTDIQQLERQLRSWCIRIDGQAAMAPQSGNKEAGD